MQPAITLLPLTASRLQIAVPMPPIPPVTNATRSTIALASLSDNAALPGAYSLKSAAAAPDKLRSAAHPAASRPLSVPYAYRSYHSMLHIAAGSGLERLVAGLSQAFPRL